MSNSRYRTSTIRYHIYLLLEPRASGSALAKSADLFLVFLILLNVAAVFAESFESFAAANRQLLDAFEALSVAVFSLEYVLRVVTADFKFSDRSYLRAVAAFVTSPLAFVDMAAILPFYIPLLIPVDLRFLRVLRLIRLFRLFKVSRYTNALRIIGSVLRQKASDLAVTIFVTFLLLLVASSLMYHLESDVQPDAFPNMLSSLWWAVATLTTVGYGDVYPVTAAGRVLAGVIAVLGVGLVALPTGIISSGFLEALQSHRERTRHRHRSMSGGLRRRMPRPSRGEKGVNSSRTRRDRRAP